MSETRLPFRSLGLLIWLSAAALFLPLFVPMATGRLFVGGDLSDLHLPGRYVYQEALRHGDSPLWTPAFFSGLYIYGEGQVGMAHPLHYLLYRFLFLDTAFNLEIAMSYVAAFSGAYLLLRRLNLSVEGALFGSMAFTFCGFNLLHLMHVNMIAVVSHVPWLLLSTHVLLVSEERRRRALAFASIVAVFASQLLLGHPQSVWFTLVVQAWFMFLICGRHAPMSRVALLVTALVAGGLIGSVQWLPTLDVLRASVRGTITPAFRMLFSLHPLNVIQLWSPYVFASRTYADVPGEAIPHELGLYTGAFSTVALAWLAVRWRSLQHRRLAAALLVLGLFGFILALGRFGGLYALVSYLPGVSSFRAPARHIFLVHLALAGVAAVVFDDLVGLVRRQERIRVRRLWPLGVPVALSLATLAGSLAFAPWALAQGILLRGAPGLSVGTLLVVGAVLAAARGLRLAIPALVLFVAFDQGVYGYRYVWSPSPPQTLDALISGADVPLAATAGEYLTSRPGDHWRNLAIFHGLRMSDGYTGLVPSSTFARRDELGQRIGGVAWRATETGWSRVPDPMPRARLVAQAIPSNDPGADSRRVNISDVAIVDRRLPLLSGPPGLAAVLADRPGHLVIDVDAPAAQRLVATERFHEGWHATDGEHDCPTVRVYGDYLGCVVDADMQRVTFVFAPARVREGRWHAFSGLVLAMIVTTAIGRSKTR